MRSLFLNVLLIVLVSAQSLPGQVKNQTQRQEQSEDVLRVKTELVQTDVTVVDKRGRFVDGLHADDFELRVDSRPQSLSFFEEVVAGSVDEEKQLTAARKGDTAALAKLPKTSGSANDRGRVIFFFVDDLHLSSESLTRARSVITHFVENKMTAKDRVAVVSTSGQIGFLQQLTDNKAVLREAISRLNSKYNPETTASNVSISEVDATLVANHGDSGLFAYLVEATMKEFQSDALNAFTIVTNRVRQINAQSTISELNTLSRLLSLMRSSTPLAGRKLLFFISDGFVVDAKRSNGADVMRRVANEAARVGVVIYSLATRASSLGPGVDVSSNGYPDFSPRTASRGLAESKLPQEPLETLAEETGGRSFLNPSALNDGVADALTESAAYYLLAWRPDSDNQRAGKSQIKVVVKGRPDLRVRMRRHFFDFRENTKTAATAPGPGTPDDDLKRALGSLYPRRDLPASVSASFVNTKDKGTVLNVSMEINGESLSFEESGGKERAIVDVLGVAIDDRGRFSTFSQKLDIPREVLRANNDRLIKWTQALPLPPGLYQIRLAVRDRQTGHTGSAMTWLEIPAQ
ncbi:MAG TPA: VWA domain-containing protein [Pyrinomonadaceae bacterium]|nr:VWA domain-containing protein [Pyrinomonadaceae bacterium]